MIDLVRVTKPKIATLKQGVFLSVHTVAPDGSFYGIPLQGELVGFLVGDHYGTPEAPGVELAANGAEIRIPNARIQTVFRGINR